MSLPTSGRDGEATDVTDQMFRKSSPAAQRMLEQWGSMEEMERPLSRGIAATFLGQNYDPGLGGVQMSYSSGIEYREVD